MEELVQWFTISASGANASAEYEDDFSYLTGIRVEQLEPLVDGVSDGDTIVGGPGDDFLLVAQQTFELTPDFGRFDTPTGLPGFADEWVAALVDLVNSVDTPFQVQAAALDETGSFDGDTAEQILIEFLAGGMEITDGTEFRVRPVFAPGNPGDYEVDIAEVATSSPEYNAFAADRPGGSSSFIGPTSQGRDLRPGESRRPTDGDDLLYDPNGSDDNDGLDALRGNDTVIGGLGSDTLFGSDGDDELIGYDDVSGRDDENDGRDRLDGGAGDDLLDGGEGDDVLLGGEGDDTALGGGGRDEIGGGDGNDSLDGGNGQDVLQGGGGDDTLDGGPGNDEIEGGPGNDMLLDTIDGNDTYRQIGGFGIDMLRDTRGANTVQFAAGTQLSFSRGAASDLEVAAGAGNLLTVLDYYAGLAGLFTFRVGAQTVEVDLAPENLALSGTSVLESAAVGAPVGQISATDPEGGTISYSLTVNPDGAFAVDGASLVVAQPLDFEARTSYPIVLRASDRGGNAVEAAFTIAVLDAEENSPPGVPRLSATSVPEDTPLGGLVGRLSATDADGDALSFRLTDDAGGRFQIVGADLLVGAPLDFETAASHVVRIEVSDGEAATATSFSIRVTDVPDTGPTGLALAPASVPEDAAPGTVVGQVSATDPQGDTISFRLADDAGGLFALEGSDLVVAGALDFETAPAPAIVLAASDGASETEAAITVAVTDVPEPPTLLALDGTSAEEGLDAVGDTVGRVSAEDPEGGPIAYSLSDDADGRFRIEGDALIVARALDFEAFQSHEITVVAEDDSGLATSAAFTIAVVDEAETPGGGERIQGSPQDDVLEIAVSGAGDDALPGGNGNDTIDGLEGTDTVVYDLVRADIVEAVINPGQISVVIGGDQTDELNSIERIRLNDGTYLYDAREEATYTYLTYSAALGRRPDAAGLLYWEGLREDGLSDRALARSFINSREFAERFGGSDIPIDDYVCALFENVLERPGDPAGKDFWIGEIAAGRIDRIDALRAFVVSPENIEKNEENVDDGFWVL